jgi:adenylate kinase
MLVPDDLITKIVLERLDQSDCQQGCLLDGFPRTVAQAEVLDEYLRRNGKTLDAVISISVPEDNLIRRLLARGRADDKPDLIQKRFEVYASQTEPLIQYYKESGPLRMVDGSGTPEEVQRRVFDCVEMSDA